MKRLIVIAAMFLIGFLACKPAEAQLSISLGVNIGSQPDWGPVGYEHVDYYYMPDIDAYYYVPSHVFIYRNGGAWVRTAYLPPRYRDYDLYHGYKVVINGREPWRRDDFYRDRYARYRGHHDQVIIRDSRDDRYRDHWHGDNGHHYGEYKHEDHGDRGHDHGHGHGHGHGHDD